MSIQNVLDKFYPGKTLPSAHMEILRKIIEESNASPRDKRIVWLRWGEGMKLAKIGEQVGLTRERVRQIEAKMAEEIFPQLLPYLEDKPVPSQPAPLTLDGLMQALEDACRERDRIRRQFREALKDSRALNALREYGRCSVLINRREEDKYREARRMARESYKRHLPPDARSLQNQYARMTREIGYIRRAIEKVRRGETVYRIKIARRRSQR